MELLASSHCQGSRSPFIFTLDVYRFRDGSSMGVCGVWGSDFENTNTNLWRASSPNAPRARCIVGVDVDGTNSFGLWTFDAISADAATATYADPGSAAHGSVVNLQCSVF
jgi:hypothetical protein